MQDPSPAAPAPSTGEPVLRRVRRRLRRVVAVVLLVVVGRVFLAEPVRISSGSMGPTLLEGDVVLVDRRHLDAPELRRGDLVTFENPQTADESLKRVIALPGDTVATIDAVVHVNGKPVDEPYVDFSDWEGIFAARVEVSAGAVYLLGDNRGDSVDSRDFGPVPVERLDGRVLVRLWPPVRLGAEPPQPPRPLGRLGEGGSAQGGHRHQVRTPLHEPLGEPTDPQDAHDLLGHVDQPQLPARVAQAPLRGQRDGQRGRVEEHDVREVEHHVDSRGVRAGEQLAQLRRRRQVQLARGGQDDDANNRPAARSRPSWPVLQSRPGTCLERQQTRPAAARQSDLGPSGATSVVRDRFAINSCESPITAGSRRAPNLPVMSSHTIDTKFGLVDVRVHGSGSPTGSWPCSWAGTSCRSRPRCRARRPGPRPRPSHSSLRRCRPSSPRSSDPWSLDR